MNKLELAINVALYDIGQLKPEYEFIDFVIDDIVQHYKIGDCEINILKCVVINELVSLKEMTLSDLLKMFLRADKEALYMNCICNIGKDERKMKINANDVKFAIEQEIRDRIIAGKDK